MVPKQVEKLKFASFSFSPLYWIAWPGYILFFMMLFVPTTYQLAKLSLMLWVLGMILVRIFARGRLSLHPLILLWTLFMVTVSLGFIFLGMINNAPGALRVGTVYVVWPMVFILFVIGVANENLLLGLFKVMVSASLAIGLYSLSYVSYASGWLPEYLYLSIDQGQAMGFYDGFVEFRLYSISSLLFLVPFLVGVLLTWPKTKIPIPRTCLWVALIISFWVVLLSGRRVLLLVVALSPFITLILRGLMPQVYKKENKKLVIMYLSTATVFLLMSFGFLQYFYDIRLSEIWSMFMQGFDFYSDASASARGEQFFALLRGWIDSPLVGAGHGASAEGSLRSSEMPWAYELSYLALLFQTGLLGFFAYASGVIWIFWMGIRMIRSGESLGIYILPILVGMTCFLIGNATNPYLAKFDYMWVVFLPVAFINHWLITRSKNMRILQ